ncbi:MAG: rhamnogalacturonan acetylesterase [Acidobacteriaceae bacterium]
MIAVDWKKCLGTGVLLAGALAFVARPAQAQPTLAQTDWNFVCGRAKAPAGAVKLTAATLHGKGADAGFDLDTTATIGKNFCSSDKPFFFSQTVPEGNYLVTLVLGGDADSTTTVKAESRRLMVYQMHTAPGKSVKRSFVVNIRTPQISATEHVKLKPREIGALDWDNKLTLEFNGEHPSVRSISIRKVDVPTIYIAGDSTVVDQDKEPWAAWGQMLPWFFDSKIAIANHAESGETIKSFISEKRYDKVMSLIRPGDYLFIQFAHNDQKPGRGYVPVHTDYKHYLEQYIAAARQHGAHPVLVTSMNRRDFDANGKIIQTLGDYPAVMREVAKEQNVPLIDLNAMSKVLFDAMGPEGTLKAFVHYPAHTFPGQDTPLADNTHFNSYGAYELARCIVEGIRQDKLPIAKDLVKGAGHFDPAHPDPVDQFHMPVSPMVSTAKPYER